MAAGLMLAQVGGRLGGHLGALGGSTGKLGTLLRVGGTVATLASVGIAAVNRARIERGEEREESPPGEGGGGQRNKEREVDRGQKYKYPAEMDF